MKRWRQAGIVALAVIAAGAWAGSANSFPGGAATPETALRSESADESLAVVGEVLSLVERFYVEPERIEPATLVAEALSALEKGYPEVIVDLPGGGAPATLTVAGEQKGLDLERLDGMAGAAAVLGEALKFTAAGASNAEAEEVVYTAMRGALAALDPHTRLLDRRQIKDLQTRTHGSFGGVGFSFSVSERGILVSEILPGTPAEEVGLRVEDTITAVDDAPVAGVSSQEAVDLVRGEPGTEVSLTVARDGRDEPLTLTPVRAVIRSRSVRAETLSEEGAPPVDYIRLERFQGETSMQVQEALTKTAGGSAGVILDLRGNPGGLLNQAVSAADIFLDSGVIVSTRDRSGRSQPLKASMFGVVRKQLPLVVLINRSSASAAEVVAAALKESRALLIGERSFGKGSVQQTYPLSDGGGLLMTFRHYFTPGEVSIQSRGVEPDVLLRPVIVGEKMILGEPVAHMREGTLANAFAPQGSPGETGGPAWKVEYLREGLPHALREDGMGRQGGRKKASGPAADPAVRVAAAILRQAATANAGGSRQGLLEATGAVLGEVAAREERRIAEALAARGIEWTSPAEAALSTPLLEADIPAEIVLTGGETASVTVRVRNGGSETAHRVWGRTVSGNPVLANHDFVFGTIPPGGFREATVDIRVPPLAWQRWDTYELALREGDGREAGHFSGGAKSVPEDRRPLSYTLLLTDENPEDPRKSGDGVLAEGERLSMSIRADGGETAAPLQLNVSPENSKSVRLDRRETTLEMHEGRGEATFTAHLVEAGDGDRIELNISFRAEGRGSLLEDRVAVPVGSPYRAVEERRPPRVDLREPLPKKTGDARLPLSFEVRDETSVKDVYVLLAGKKVLYRRSGGSDPSLLPVQFEVELADGSNRIDVVARDDDDLVTRTSYFVFRLPLES